MARGRGNDDENGLYMGNMMMKCSTFNYNTWLNESGNFVVYGVKIFKLDVSFSGKLYSICVFVYVPASENTRYAYISSVYFYFTYTFSNPQNCKCGGISVSESSEIAFSILFFFLGEYEMRQEESKKVQTYTNIADAILR